MSYDLWFWRQNDDTGMAVPDLLTHLEKGESHPALQLFTQEQVAAAFQERFPDAEVGDLGVEWEGEGSYFQVSYEYGPGKMVACISVGCGWTLARESPEAMNRIIEAGNALGCALYDPQVDERYEQPDPAPS